LSTMTGEVDEAVDHSGEGNGAANDLRPH
jgi:hypothetical protein